MPKIFLKKNIWIILIIVILSGLFLVNVGGAKAAGFLGWVLGGLESVALDILRSVCALLLYVAQAFVGFTGKLFTGAINFGFKDETMTIVKTGWTITRDIVNMFFILGLIVIAFATILKIETYGIKALLPKLIIIALLINFSYLACGLLIDATQITADYFVNLIGTGGEPDVGLMIVHALGVVDAMRPSEAGVIISIGEQESERIMALTTIFTTIILFIAGFVLLVGTILLFMRVGALWILIILAPFAWFFSIFPGKLKGYANQWWENFLKWAFFAPIYVFFIYLVLMLSKKVARDAIMQAAGFVEPEVETGLMGLTAVPMFQHPSLLFNFVFLSLLLFGAPTIALSMGIKGAGAAQHFVKGAFRGAGRVAGKVTYKPAWKGVKAGYRKFDRDVLAPAGISPKAIKEGWKQRREEKEAKAYGPAIGKWMDRFNKAIDKETTFNENKAKDLMVDQERGDLRKQDLSKEELANILFEAKKSGRTDRAKAAMLEMISRADEEGPFQHPELGKKYGNLTSSESWQQLIKDTINPENTIKGNKEAMRFAGKVGTLGKQSAIPYVDGLTKLDAKGEEVWTTGAEIGERGGHEAMKMQPRQRWQLLGRRNYADMDKDGNAVTHDKDGKLLTRAKNSMRVMLQQMSAVDARHAEQYMSSTNKRFIVAAEAQIRGEIDEILNSGDLKQAAIAKNWFVAIKNSI